MKLLLCLLFTVVAHASSLEELTLRQQQLAQKFAEIEKSGITAEYIKKKAEIGDRKSVTDSLKKIRSFFYEYDQFNLDKIDFFFNEALTRARLEASLEILRSGKLSKKVQKRLQKFEETFLVYQDAKKYFRQNEDMSRVLIGQKVFEAYGYFAKELRKSRGEHPWRNFGSGKLATSVDTVPDLLRVSPKLMKLLWASYIQDQSQTPDRAPIVDAMGDVQRKLVKMRHIESKWEGLHNLKNTDHDGKTLNMFLITHANAYLDTSAQLTLPVQGMSAIGKVEPFFPVYIWKRMVKSSHMITVGHGDTNQKTIDLVRKKQLNKFFLAIEGASGVGLFEMRPIMPLFHDALYDIIKRGLEVRLYPIAFPDNFRLLNDWRKPIEGKIPARGVVLPSFDTKDCLSMRALTQSDDAISYVIRWSWFSTLNNTNDLVLSMPYPFEIADNIERMIWGLD